MALTLLLLLKLPSRKLEPWFILWSFFLLRLLCISIYLPCDFVLDTAVMSGLVFLAASWICLICYKNRYVFVELLVLHLLPLSNPWLIIEMWPLKSFLISVTLVDTHLNWFIWFHFLILKRCLLNILIDRMIFLSPSVAVIRVSLSTVSFLIQLDSGILCP